MLVPPVDTTEQARREIEQLVDLRVVAVWTQPALAAMEGRRT
jgi:hypothetical protein